MAFDVDAHIRKPGDPRAPKTHRLPTGKQQHFEQPPPGAKPPDPSKPYIWVDGGWQLVARD